MLFILVPIVIAAFIALAILGHMQAAKRRDALRQWAQAHGLHFNEQQDHGFQSRFANLDCLRQGEREAARRFYNANVRDLNTRVTVAPSNIVANMFSFQQVEFFEVEDAGVRHPLAVRL